VDVHRKRKGARRQRKYIENGVSGTGSPTATSRAWTEGEERMVWTREHPRCVGALRVRVMTVLAMRDDIGVAWVGMRG
jgi:hypothetical protein